MGNVSKKMKTEEVKQVRSQPRPRYGHPGTMPTSPHGGWRLPGWNGRMAPVSSGFTSWEEHVGKMLGCFRYLHFLSYLSDAMPLNHQLKSTHNHLTLSVSWTTALPLRQLLQGCIQCGSSDWRDSPPGAPDARGGLLVSGDWPYQLQKLRHLPSIHVKFLIQIRSSASSESHHIAPYYIWIMWTDVKCYVWRCVMFHVARPASGTAGMLGWSKEVSLEASYAVLKTITWRHKEAPAALPSGSIWMVHSHSFLMCWSKLPSFFLIKSQIHLIY